jgi:mRNA guanylyltransferase
MELSYGLDKVLKEVVPNLKHKSDGLIFTSSISGYKTGTCEKMLKWKPPHENSIDLQLSIDDHGNDEKPIFRLNKWIQKDDHTYFGEMYVTDDEWEQL